jgi:hypothetical protein
MSKGKVLQCLVAPITVGTERQIAVSLPGPLLLSLNCGSIKIVRCWIATSAIVRSVLGLRRHPYGDDITKSILVLFKRI